MIYIYVISLYRMNSNEKCEFDIYICYLHTNIIILHSTSNLQPSIATTLRNHSYKCWIHEIVSRLTCQIITFLCLCSPTITVLPYQTYYFPVLPLAVGDRVAAINIICGLTVGVLVDEIQSLVLLL